MFEADIHLRLLYTSIVDIYKVFESLVCCLKGIWVHPYTITPAMLPPDLGNQCHHIMFEADIYLRLLDTFVLEIYKVFEPLVCCLKGIWVHPYSITPAKLPPDLGIQVHLRSANDATTSSSRLISSSDHFRHPCKTYTKCLRHCLLSQGNMGALLFGYNGQAGPRFGDSGSLAE